MKKSLLFAGLVIISTNVLGMNNKLFFGNIESSKISSIARYSPMSTDNFQNIKSQNSNSLAMQDASVLTNNFCSVMSPEGLVLIVSSNKELSSGEIEKEMTKELKKILEDMRQRRKNDELIAQFIQQIQEYCDKNIRQQKTIDQLRQENIRQQKTIDQLRQENNLLQQQFSEISIVNEKNPLMLGNAWLSQRNRELLAKNAWLEEQLWKHQEFSFPKR
ncbi:MAG: SlyX family protein [Alphaproteobacteria bacterium]|nr:SlyX family protein [Alphaproteobacteria bacterium]